MFKVNSSKETKLMYVFKVNNKGSRAIRHSRAEYSESRQTRTRSNIKAGVFCENIQRLSAVNYLHKTLLDA